MPRAEAEEGPQADEAPLEMPALLGGDGGSPVGRRLLGAAGRTAGRRAHAGRCRGPGRRCAVLRARRRPHPHGGPRGLGQDKARRNLEEPT